MSSRAPGPDSEERKWHPIMLASALYAEVYLICLIVVCLLLVWNRRSVSRSSSEQWLTRLFITFILSFSCINIIYSGSSRTLKCHGACQHYTHGCC